MDLRKLPELDIQGLILTCSRWVSRRDVDPNLYYIVVGDDLLILVLYVDELFITGVERLISGCKEDFAMEFKMKDIGSMHYFLGLEVWQEEGHIFLG